MATAQQCHAMTTYFVKKHTEVVGVAPTVNRNKARWGFDSLLMDYNTEQCKVLIDYYLEHFNRNDLEWFLFNYDKVDSEKMESDQKEVSAAKRRAETAKRVQDWRNRWQQQKQK